jgi:hypothetical protein
MADPDDTSPDLPIEVLIGGDHYWKVVKDNPPFRISSSLVLLPSIFGWILSGSRSGTTVNNVMANYISLSDGQMSDEDMRRFWDLETIGIREPQDRALTAKDAAILQDFHDSYHVKEGRRVVSLPRRDAVFLSDNRSIAEMRFRALEKRFYEDADFKSMYFDHMLDYIIKEQVEVAPPDGTSEHVFYLPHHAVKKKKNNTTKWRIVFDASSHERGFPSLNDALEMGPNLLPEILATLLRFRLHRKAVVCDGSQAFLQLSLHENDRNLTRFFWYRLERDHDGHHHTTSDVIVYRFTRLPFDLTSSPFLLSATLRVLAVLYRAQYPTAAARLDESTFMDDFAASAEDDNHVITLYYELTELLKRMKLPLSKWVTNSLPLKDIRRAEGVDIKSETRVLGVDWNTESDSLFTDPRDITDNLAGSPGTKCLILRTTARFYDPLGLFAPVLLVGKVFFQDTWCRGLLWEELLPPDLAQRWHQWTSKLQHLSSLHIPRWIGVSQSGDEATVHVFCDASERAYGAVLYIRSVSETTCSVRLVCSKNRLAPLKKVTLPRLELLVALLGARLLRYFCHETGFDATRAILWSDSTVTLGWIRSDPNRWKTFVSNRITEILTSTTPSQWRHCPGSNNSADHLSRGLQADAQCSLDSWWTGPEWLVQHPDSWPHDITPCDAPLPEARKTTPQVLMV